MLEYKSLPIAKLSLGTFAINSFVAEGEANIDKKTVASFGDEWTKFRDFDDKDLDTIGGDYFDLIDVNVLSQCVALDVGCGTGRWANYLSQYVSFIEAIDPSMSVFSAANALKNKSNVRISHASVENIPFADNSFDLVYSLGVLHHLPDTEAAIRKCCEKLKHGGTLLLYLYYNFDNRGKAYRLLFVLSDLLRNIVYRLPKKLKHFTCDLIALLIYLPLVQLSRFIGFFSKKISDQMPLAYYKKTSFYIMRNDALDRFGTPLEKRFSKVEIKSMLIRSGLKNVQFSDKEPFWHVIAQKI